MVIRGVGVAKRGILCLWVGGSSTGVRVKAFSRVSLGAEE